MGLDMNLTARKYVSPYSNSELGSSILELLPEVPKGVRLNGVSVDLGYWRKVNAIHKWFVDNIADGVDNCEEVLVEINQLRELRITILEVFADRSQAELLLPTQSGFFFGNTDFDEHYFNDLTQTLDIISLAEKLSESNGYWEFYYRASW